MHIHIICKASPGIFYEFISAIQDFFFRKGHRVTVDYAFKVPVVMSFSDDVNFVIKAQRDFCPTELPNKACNILLQTEQFSKLRQFGSCPHSENWDLILDLFEDNEGRFRMSPATVRYFPVGYSEKFSMLEPGIKTNNKIYDVSFFGARTKYRSEIWNKYIGSKIKKSRFANNIWGFEKHQMIRQTRVNIFLDGWAQYSLSILHCMQVWANGGFLLEVTEEPRKEVAPYIIGFHYWSISTYRAAEYIKELISDRNRISELSMIAQESLSKFHTMDYYLTKCLEGFVDV